MRKRRPCRAAAAATLLLTLVGATWAGVGGTRIFAQTTPAVASAQTAGAAQPPTAADGFEPVLGLPATGGGSERSVTLIGASPAEGSEEVWAYGQVGDVPAVVNGTSYADQYVLLEHSAASLAWQVVPLPPGPEGKPLAQASGGSTFPRELGPLDGRAIADGGVVLLTEGGIVTRDPGGQPQLASAPEPKPQLLGKEESLPPQRPGDVPTPYAAIEDREHTGLLIAPYNDGADASEGTAPGILHYDGTKWTREPLEGPSVGGEAKLTPEALACGGTSTTDTNASSPSNCWLLAAYSSEPSGSLNRLALFRRVPSAAQPSGYLWRQQPVAGGLLGGEPASTNVAALPTKAQMLTVTSQGVWVDFEAQPGGQSSTVETSELLTPSGESLAPAGKWCYPTVESVCPQSLSAPLPMPYRSFAWPGSGAGAGADSGNRIITGISDGALLELSGGKFLYTVGAGGEYDGDGGAAFSSPQEGWISGGRGTEAEDGEGKSQLVRITPKPQGDQLHEEPVPFRYPLLALVQAPGSTPGDPNAQALAVGVNGEIARYVPDQGWRPEALYDEAGKVQPPTLRGVAWPESGRAYAVGDGGAMWVWQAATGLWEPDPAKPPGFDSNLTAIAFSSSEPNLGYAVGKDGTILRYGKSWEVQAPPKELQHVNFTSVAFAGDEAIATYRVVYTPAPPEPTGQGPGEEGGIAVSEAGGLWHIDQSAATLLGGLHRRRDTVLSKVAGLPDGGAVAAGPGLVVERGSPTEPWRFSSEPLPEAENVSALGAFRDNSGVVRAVISIDVDHLLNPNCQVCLSTEGGPFSGDLPQASAVGEPPYMPPADPLPNSGYVLKETATGWEDMQHMALPAYSGGVESNGSDLPERPDPVFALLVDPTGVSGLAVGGQTDDSSATADGVAPELEAQFETSAAMRFGPDAQAAAVASDTPAPIATTPGEATFAIGGNAACQNECADYANDGLGPDVSLSHALQTADQIAAQSPGGLRGFLYTGGRLESRARGCESPECEEHFERELERYASLLGQAQVPVLAAASPNDRAPGGIGIGPFASILAKFLPGAQSGEAYYSFLSAGASGGPVQVIVLDYSGGALGEPQQAWLEGELRAAKQHGVPAIVMGNAAPNFLLQESLGPGPLEAQDAETLSAILVTGSSGGSQCQCGASAYLFDYPGRNVEAEVSYGAGRIPAFGTGTLGYTVAPSRFGTDYLGSSGFLLLDVDTGARDPTTNLAPVHARSEPNIGQLALDATDGVLLRRSQVALFEALARRPAQGLTFTTGTNGRSQPVGAYPYEPIPFTCLGPDCVHALPTDYTFSSSRPDIGDFVAHDPSSNNPRQVLLGPNRLPVADPRSGLFCAFNGGTTTVTITAGGLSYSEPITVQAGSVEYPCGTVPLKNPPALEAPASVSFPTTEPKPAGSPPSPAPHLQTLAPPAPAPVPHASPPKPAHTHPTPAPVFPFVPAVPGLGLLRPVLLPVPPTIARPAPPSGTSTVQVSQSVTAPQVAPRQEKEEEEATDLVYNMAAARGREGGRPVPYYLPVVILLLAFGGAHLRGRRRDDACVARCDRHI